MGTPPSSRLFISEPKTYRTTLHPAGLFYSAHSSDLPPPSSSLDSLSTPESGPSKHPRIPQEVSTATIMEEEDDEFAGVEEVWSDEEGWTVNAPGAGAGPAPGAGSFSASCPTSNSKNLGSSNGTPHESHGAEGKEGGVVSAPTLSDLFADDFVPPSDTPPSQPPQTPHADFEWSPPRQVSISSYSSGPRNTHTKGKGKGKERVEPPSAWMMDVINLSDDEEDGENRMSAWVQPTTRPRPSASASASGSSKRTVASSSSGRTRHGHNPQDILSIIDSNLPSPQRPDNSVRVRGQVNGDGDGNGNGGDDNDPTRLVLTTELSAREQEFYNNHWRRGADKGSKPRAKPNVRNARDTPDDDDEEDEEDEEFGGGFRGPEPKKRATGPGGRFARRGGFRRFPRGRGRGRGKARGGGR